ncbi:SDR family NAD(P)-dependent oxidoreductase [Streptomyces sp. NPDC051643]|uniref:SDR family NAD(P)-dependent oxidoreductase n=1 Tax=Streptomyces sp. NPDC051643 TaxID=3365665 RepID=UPI0037AD47D3
MSTDSPERPADIAIIGLALRFPGSDNLVDLFGHLAAGRSLISEVSPKRWSKDQWYANPRGNDAKTSSVWGGFVEDADCFDASFFNISPREAASMDPQQRFALELAWQAIEDAGYRAGDLAGTRTGVFMGVSHADYAELMERDGARSDAYLSTGTAFAVVPNRISYFFDLHGPSLANDTACASSLVSMYEAVTALRNGDCDLALAGGVNLAWSPKLFVAFSQANMLSPTGKSHSFDDRADGFVRGEGGAVLLLKPLAAARADGDPVHAVIKGAGTNHGGKTNSLTVTNPAAQARLIEDVHTRAGVSPETVGYIEAHGPGTPVGDPIEVIGLKRAFQSLHTANGTEPQPRTCGIGSVKTNIGHLESAAGVAGVVKVIGAFATGLLPATVNFESQNRLVDFDGSPFYVVRDTSPWPALPAGPDGRPAPRRAGVSAFGFAGTNAHCVLEEYPADDTADRRRTDGPQAVPLSAKTAERLRALAGNLAEHLRPAEPGDKLAASLRPAQELADIAYTLQVGREPMGMRVAFVVETRQELLTAVRAFLDGELDDSAVHLGAGVDPARAAGPLEVAQRWTGGDTVDWSELHDTAAVARPRRVRLPAYPFARERHWFALPETAPEPPTPDRAELHPLVHRNTSTFSEQRYSSTFTGDEPFLASHLVREARVMPAVAYVEMARAAARDSLGEADRVELTLRDVTWLRPLVVAEQPVDVSVRLAREDEGTIRFEVCEDGGTPDSAPRVHCQGVVEAHAPTEPERLDLDALRAACPTVRETARVYADFREQRLAYGPALRGLDQVFLGADELVARLRPQEAAGDGEGVALPPGLLDPVFQASLVLKAATARDTAPTLPFLLERIDVLSPCSPGTSETAETWAWVRRSPGSRVPDTFDIDVCDGEGVVSVRIRGLVQRTAPSKSEPAPVRVVTAVPRWTDAPVVPGAGQAADSPSVHGFLTGPAAALRSDVARATGFSVDRLPDVSRARTADGVGEVLDAFFAQVRGVVTTSPRKPHRFVVLVDDRTPRHFHAPLAGLLRTAVLENPLVSGRVVRVPDLDIATPEHIASILRTEAAADTSDAEIRHTAAGTRQARRPVETDLGEGPRVPPGREGGVYWVTGGLGGIGRHVARYLARRTGTTVVLSGRSAAGPTTEAGLAALREAGVDAHYLPVDVGRKADVERAVDAIVREHGSLDGIVHAAGILRDAYILRKDVTDFHAVLEPKVRGTLNLDAATRDLDLDFFVLFSSVAGVYGNPGQCDYASANVFLDAFAQHRQALVDIGERAGRSVAVSWSLWAEGGMTLDDVTRESMRRQRGWEPLPTEAGLRVIGRAIAGGADHIVVACGDDAVLTPEGLTTPPAAPSAPAVTHPAVAQPASGSTAVVEPAAEYDLTERTTELIRGLLAEVLQHDPQRITTTTNLVEYGIDSLSILDMTARLEQTLGPISKTIFFEYLNVEEVVQYFVESHGPKLRAIFDAPQEQPAPQERSVPEPPARPELPAQPEPAAPQAALPAAVREDRHDIAIIGISAKYPGADTLDELWTLLEEGRHRFEEPPRDRWDHDRIYSSDRAMPGKSVIRTGTFLRGIDTFDPRYFRISKRDAEQMSPEVRLFLQAGVEALEDAGYSRETIHKQHRGEVGVLAGTMSNNYGLYGFQNSLVRGAPESGSYNATIPNMLSYFYGLTGPSVFVDTMCSSSSTCVHQAVQMLRAGECEMVVAGGVNLLLHPYNLITSSQEHFTSATSDVIRSFGLGVDGTVLGEGAGAVVLKPLADAERDGDHVYAVIKGTALSNAGVRNGFTVPNPHMQKQAVEKAIEDSGVDPRTISYVEGHGSGTSLGDPIEVKALTKAFRQYTADTGYCALGSVKSNLGHLLAAAGMVGIAKVVLQMQKGMIAPSLHSEELNPDIDFSQTPFTVQRELVPWTRPVTSVDGVQVEHPRRAGITSIGAGGMNSHLVLEEYRPTPQEVRREGSELFVFSAMTDEALTTYVERFRAFMAEADDADLASIAHTLRVGKNELPRRWAFLAKDVRDAVDALDRYLAGDRTPGLADAGPRTARARELAADWVGGASVDWSELTGPQQPRRVPLPAYPFAEVRCWVSQDPEAPSVTTPLVFRNRLHPFLGRNESDVDGLRYGCDARLDDLLDYVYRQDGAARATPLFAADAAFAVAGIAAFADDVTVRDLRLLRPVEWPDVTRLVTTFDRAPDGTAFGTVYTEDREGARTPAVAFDVHRGDGRRAPYDARFTHPAGGPDTAVRTLTGAEFLVELSEGGLVQPPEFCGVETARWLPDGALVLSVGTPRFQQDHARRNTSVEPYVLTAIAQGIALAARRSGLPRWAHVVPHRIGEVRLFAAADGTPPPVEAAHVVFDMNAGAEGLDGRIRLVDGSGQVVAELIDVSCADEDGPRADTTVRRRELPADTITRSRELNATAPRPAAPATGTRVSGTASDDEGVLSFTVAELRDMASGILKFDVEELDAGTGFYAFGFDSISFVTFAGLVGERFGIALSPAVFFEADTLNALGRHLMEEFGPQVNAAHAHASGEATEQRTDQHGAPGAAASAAPAGTTPEAPPEQTPAAETTAPPRLVGWPMDIAVIGAAGRFPGARDLDEYWANLVAGTDSVSAFPVHRYDETYTRVVEEAEFPQRMGAIDDVDAFDAGFFGIHRREAELMDPQQRLALETVWSALEDSAYRPGDLPKDTGVFMGVSGSDYTTLLTTYGIAPDAYTSTGNAHSMLANRISYLLDVRGPSEPVDTACSSSLIAVHRAMEAIRSGACGMAVAGGVNLLLSVDTFVSAARAGMLSPEGRCKAFSADADGYVRGEGVGAVVLKPLADALRDKDAIYCVLRASAENHGGRANSLTAPNADAQAELVATALEGIDPDSIGYVEAHGTGTALGDPVEVRGLRSAHRRLGGSAPWALGSVKTNIGHLEAAAGIAGLLKVVLSMQHGLLPATLHCEELNAYMELEDGPFRIVRENEPWPRRLGRDGLPVPRRAGVSSFGFGGVNGHVVVEEYTDPQDGEPDGAGDTRVIVPLSARTEDRLREVARNLLSHLEGVRTPPTVRSIAWSLQTGRQAMEERVGWVVSSRAELTAALRAFLSGTPGAGGAIRGTVPRTDGGPPSGSRGSLPPDAAPGDLDRVLAHWTEGADVDWRALYGTDTPRRTHLPSYPFARERYWVPGHEPGDRPVTTPEPEDGPGTAYLVPRWATRPAPSNGAGTPAPARHVVVLLDGLAAAYDAVASRLPGARCVRVETGMRRTGNRFGELSRKVFEAVRDVMDDGHRGQTLVQVMAPVGGADAVNLALTGVLRTAAIEAPRLTGRLIGVDGALTGDAVAELAAREIAGEDDVVLYRGGTRSVRTWHSVPAPTAADGSPWRTGGVYLITGGTGGVGAAVARHIARTTTRATLVLAGRAPRDERIDDLLGELRAAGANARYHRADISRWEEVRHLVAAVRGTAGEINGVIHSAGVVRDSSTTAKTAGEWEDVLAPKVDGLLNLDRAIGGAPLDFLLTFSSGVAVTGNAGQADYAAANAFLDEFTALRSARVEAGERCGRTMSVLWPLWRDGGMRVSDAVRRYLWEARGLVPMPTADAMAALHSAWQLGENRVWVHHGDPARIPADTGRPPAGPRPARPGASGRGVRDNLRLLVEGFAEVTKVPAAAVDVDARLDVLGLDSITAIQLNAYMDRVHDNVAKTLFYDFSTLREIAEHLSADQAEGPVGGHDEPTAPSSRADAAPAPHTPAPPTTAPSEHAPSTTTRSTTASPTAADEPIAIIGMSGRYPHAANVGEFWENLKSGTHCIDEVPGDRWPLEGFFESDRRTAVANGRSYSKWGGFVDDFAAFDPLFFQIAPRDAYAMDPQERLFLQTAWEALEDSGYTRQTLARRHEQRVGVFAGVTKSGHARHGTGRLGSGETVVPGLSFASLSQRTSYVLDAHGPSLTIDTMCSASLTAVHEACEHLRRGSCEVAFAGGANIYTHPLEYVELCHSGMLSEDDRCRSFGSGGHGFVPGEGVGCVVLKPLSRAVADGDQVLAVIRGSSVNHGGRSNGYTVPRSGAQAELIREALTRAGVSARDVGYVEAHGTGTELGDPIEIQGLSTAFGQDTADRQFCAIGSAKSAIGHLEAAAGIAGLTKAVLQLRHRQIAPTLHAEDLNPNIDFGRTPFFVQRQATPWESDRPLVAAVSSFGAGGSNAHVIVEEYRAPAASAAPDGAEHLVVLSARTPGQLDEAVARLAAHAERTDVRLGDLAFTLQTGREAMRERLAVVASSTSELTRTLRACLAGADVPAGVHRGTADAARTGVSDITSDGELRRLLTERWARAGEFAKLGALWVAGAELDWDLLHEGTPPRRVSLPAYPFARDRYWIGDLGPAAAGGTTGPRPGPSVPAPNRAAADAGLRADSVSGPDPAPALIRTDEYVARLVRRTVADALAMEPDEIAGSFAFHDYGLDSILAVRVAHELGEALSVDLATSVLFDHSTTDRLTAHLLAAYGDVIRPVGPAEPAVASAPAADPSSPSAVDTGGTSPRGRHTADGTRVPIAVVGMSGRFADADSLDDLWSHLVNGDDLVTEASWDDDAGKTPGATPVRRRGSFLDRLDGFDALFFNISGIEAAGMDPQQRVFLEEAWKALEDAGYAGYAMDERRCGVYVGAWAGDYAGAAQEGAPAQALWGNMGSVIAGRVSYFLNLKGPALAVDTSCSSSLVAIDLACKDLWSGETEMALAGGVFLQTTPRLYERAGRAGMLSPTGRCHTFDDRADGFVPGEGAGVIVLKRLDDALADGDHIHGVIRGSAVNGDGATNGLTAPSSLSQERLLTDAYDRFGVDVERIGLVEAHGTGTELGDPIEFQALTRAFRKYTDKSGYCALGSVKTNLGHAQFAAGIAGVLKVLLALKHRQIPASLHFQRANQAIDLDTSPFYLSDGTHPWRTPPGVPACGVVSAFGASGTNAHLVLEEAPARQRAGVSPAAHLVVLSAHSQEQLSEQVARLAEHCRRDTTADCAEIAYTLAVGRAHLPHRFACVVRDREDLVRVLDQGLRGTEAFTGRAPARGALPSAAPAGEQALNRCADAPAAVDPGAHRADLGVLARLYVRGDAPDLGGLYARRTPQRVSLPTYPFARESHWAGPERHTHRADSGVPRDARRTGSSALPALPAEPSRHSESLELTGAEYFLQDHRVHDRQVLPGVAFLELARPAAERALGARRGAALRMRNVTWVRPLVVDGGPVGVRLDVRPVGGGAVAFEFAVPDGPEASEGLEVTGGTAVSDGTNARAAGDRREVFCEGTATWAELPRPTRADLRALRAECPTTVSEARIDQALRAMGITHGPALRGITEAYAGPRTVLARLRVPASAARPDASATALHPSVLDSAIQASAALHLAAAGSAAPQPTTVPFALERLDLIAPCVDTMWAVLRVVGEDDEAGPLSRLDIDLLDDAGEVCVRMTGYSSRRTAEPVPSLFAPVWDALPDSVLGAPLPSREDHVLVVGGTAEQRSPIADACPRATFWELGPEASVEETTRALRAIEPVDHLVWIAPETVLEPTDTAGFVAAQEHGVVAAFRMVKGLLGTDHDQRPLGATLVTRQSLATHQSELNHPVHAGVHGLFGSLAREYTNWTVRRVDLDDEPWPEDLTALPAHSDGDVWTRRHGQWLARRWAACDVVATPQPPYRSGGVYVVIGGAGGVGTEWTRHVVEEYGAHVVWIGRRPLDATIENAMRSMRGPGEVRYIAADAADPDSLRGAWTEIKSRYPVVHGVVHAALVLRDQSIARMDESALLAVLSAKVDASVATAEVFAGEDLDFVLFFSSMQSFATAAGQGNYAAACTFSDAYAHFLAREWDCPVKVVNWGWWGDTGSVTSEFYRRRMQQAGLVSIEPAEAMSALDTLLGGPQEQLGFFKTTGLDAVEAIDPGTRTLVYERAESPTPARALAAAGTDPVDRRALDEAADWRSTERDPMLARLLRAHLQSLGVLADGDDADTDPAVLCARAGIHERYETWLRHALRVVPATAPQLDAAYQEWEECRAKWSSTHPDVKAELALLDAALRALPGILTGATRPTDVLFPHGSFELVEGCYRDNPVADAFNRAVADTVVNVVTERLRQEPGAKLRILEIGAGTGGTSAGVFAALRPLSGHIEAYTYTDLSKAFLNNARTTYGPATPYLEYQLLDAERPLAEQGVETGGYDVVIAANVLHATRDIRNTIRNGKAALRDGGWLVLNELTHFDIFSHLTFGLLDGWWLFEDAALRIPGSPALSPEGWRRVLESEGFRSVVSVLPHAAPLGQQVIAAESDGIARQQRTAGRAPQAPEPRRDGGRPKPGRPAVPALRQQPAPAPAETRVADPAVTPVAPAPAVAADGHEAAVEAMTGYLRDKAAEVLAVPADRIDPCAPLTDYGLDSLLVLRLTNSLREDLGHEIPSTLLFDEDSVEKLAAHFLARRDEAVDALLARLRPAPGRATERWDLSRSQLGLWQTQRSRPGSVMYNVPMLFEIHGELDERALEEACRAQAGLHPLLGAVFREEDGVPYMEMNASPGLSFEKADVLATSRAEQLSRLREMADVPFDLSTGPLVRVHLVSLPAPQDAPGPRLLLITVHHLIADGTSAALLVASLRDSYREALGVSEPAPADDRTPTPFAEFVAWEAALLESTEGAAHRDYWTRELRPPRAALDLPYDRPHDDGLAFRSGVVSTTLEPSLAEALATRARSGRTSVAVVFLASYLAFLHKVTRQSDIVVGFPTAARYEDRFAHTIGQFVNCLPIRCAVTGGQSFAELLRTVQRLVASGIEHGAYPFIEIKRALEAEGDPDAASTVVSNLLFQNFEGASLFTAESTPTPGELGLRPFDDLPDAGERPLTVEIYQDRESYKVFFKYDANVFDAETVRAMLDSWRLLVARMAKEPDAHIDGTPWEHPAAAATPDPNHRGTDGT